MGGYKYYLLKQGNAILTHFTESFLLLPFVEALFLVKNLVNSVEWAISYLNVPNYEPVCLFEFWGIVDPLTGHVSLKSETWGTHGLTLKPAVIRTRDYSNFSVDEYNYNDLFKLFELY